jgi:hypothetical protein
MTVTIKTKKRLPRPRTTLSKSCLLDGARSSDVDWQALQPISQDGTYRGGCASWVYFVEETDTGFLKIGLSGDPLRRRADMQTGTPHPLRVIRCLYGYEKTEQLLHQAFSYWRVENTREWFSPSGRSLILVVADEIINRQLNSSYDSLMDKMHGIACDVIKHAGIK